MLERLGVPMECAPLLGWGNVANWASHVQGDQASATWRALNPDYAGFSGSLQTNALLADLFDLYVSANKKKNSVAKPYPRPWRQPTSSTYGAAVPVEEIDGWYAQ